SIEPFALSLSKGVRACVRCGAEGFDKLSPALRQAQGERRGVCTRGSFDRLRTNGVRCAWGPSTRRSLAFSPEPVEGSGRTGPGWRKEFNGRSARAFTAAPAPTPGTPTPA